MADNLIPEPQIQATNIPTGGGAQVRFDFAAPDNTFANLSKTIASAGQTMVNFNQLEENERKARDEFRANLDQIHGLTKTGQLSQADYEQIQREANAKAQKEGIIRAHENWSTITDVQKQRSSIRAKAIAKALETTGAIDRMSNPNEGIATKWDTEYSTVLESLSEQALGKDSQGNHVFLDLDNMTPMEMVAFAQEQSVLEAATKLAVDENRHNRAVEASTANFSNHVFEHLTNYDKDLTVGSELPEGLNVDYVKSIENSISVAHHAGVKDISTHVFESLKAFAEEEALYADISDEAALDNAVAIFDDIGERLLMREGIFFAAEGTKNRNTLNDIKFSMITSFQKRVKDGGSTEPDKDKYKVDLQEAMVAKKANGEPIDRAFRLEWMKEANKQNIPWTHDTQVDNFIKNQVANPQKATNKYINHDKAIEGATSVGELAKAFDDAREDAINGNITETQFDKLDTDYNSKKSTFDQNLMSSAEEIASYPDSFIKKGIDDWTNNFTRGVSSVRQVSFDEASSSTSLNHNAFNQLLALQREAEKIILEGATASGEPLPSITESKLIPSQDLLPDLTTASFFKKDTDRADVQVQIDRLRKGIVISPNENMRTRHDRINSYFLELTNVMGVVYGANEQTFEIETGESE